MANRRKNHRREADRQNLKVLAQALLCMRRAGGRLDVPMDVRVALLLCADQAEAALLEVGYEPRGSNIVLGIPSR